MAYRDHLLDRIKIDLQFLVDSNDLSSYDYEQIVSKLPFPTPQRAMMPPLPQRPQQAQPEMRAPVPEMARVLHSYVQGQPDDLGLIQGEEVTLLERKNSDWWRGQKSDGSVGIFPSNHVELIQNNQVVTQQAPVFNSNNSYATPQQNQNQNWNLNQGPDQQQQQSYSNYNQNSYSQQNEKVDPYYPQSQPYQQQQVYQQSQQPQQQLQNGPPIVPKKKFLNGNFKQALVSGAGFGVGSAVASEAIHAIF